MSGLTLGGFLGLGLPTLALHVGSVALARALRTYSRSRLEERCEERGRPERAGAIALHGLRNERAADALGLLTGLALAALLGAAAVRLAAGVRAEFLVACAVVLGAIAHIAADLAGRVFAEPLLDAAWPVAEGIGRAMAPFVAVARMLEGLASRVGGRTGPVVRPPSVEVEIHHTVGEDESDALEAELPESTREMLARVVELGRRDVSELMIPRASIKALAASISGRDAARAFAETGLSRIPLFGEHRDDIVGILYAKDLFARGLEHGPDAIKPREIARAPLFVPETKNAAELLEELRSRRVQMAVVLDEYGSVAGLITLEDLIEEIVGAIDDEHDQPTGADPVMAVGDRVYEVDGSLPLEDLNERLDLNLPTDGDFTTVGGLAFDALGRVPKVGDQFRVGTVEITVLAVVDHAIRRLKLDLAPSAAPVRP